MRDAVKTLKVLVFDSIWDEERLRGV